MKIRSSLAPVLFFAVSLPLLGADAQPGATPPSPPAVKKARPPAPTRLPNAPGTPKLTVVGAKPGEEGSFRAAPGRNPPVDAEGDFLIGPDYVRAPELTAVEGVPK